MQGLFGILVDREALKIGYFLDNCIFVQKYNCLFVASCSQWGDGWDLGAVVVRDMQ